MSGGQVVLRPRQFDEYSTWPLLASAPMREILNNRPRRRRVALLLSVRLAGVTEVDDPNLRRFVGGELQLRARLAIISGRSWRLVG
jgi:hypothetical protein